MNTETAHKLTVLILFVLLLNLFAFGYSFYTGYQGRKDIVTTQRLGCERGKKDRTDNARFQSAHKLYIDKVVLAKSVEEDVKAAARTAVETYNQTARDLTIRAQIDCTKVFPKARLIP
jgi:hypothetical protein